MPSFYPSPFIDPIPVVSGDPKPELIDGRMDTSLDITTGSLAAAFTLAEGNDTVTLGAVYIYTDDGITSPVALSEQGGIVRPDTITTFTPYSKLQKNFRLWYTDLTGAPRLFRAHFTRDIAKTVGKVYQIYLLPPAFLDIPSERTFQRIDLSAEIRGRVVHTGMYGKRTVVPDANPNEKRRVAYRSRFQDKALALNLVGILEQYPHFLIAEDVVNFPERIYESYLEDATIRYNYSTTYRGSGFDLELVIQER